jgi:hypothetical protein
LSPARGPHSPLSKLRSSSDGDLFYDWPEANDIVASVYVMLTTDASSSRAPTVSSPHYTRKSCIDDSSTRQSRTRATSSQKPRRWKSALSSAPWRKSKKIYVDVEHTLAAPIPHGGSLSATNFDRSEWEIMYHLFVEDDLCDGPPLSKDG